MLKNQAINLKIVEKVAKALGDLNNDVIYVGGAIVSFYATDKAAELPRPTMDIDISVQISSYTQMEQLRKKLAERKIFPATFENVMYRYHYDNILIDFIPYEQTSLGPTNSWLKPGFKHSINILIGNEKIKILPVSYYLATKWEAYKNRGTDPRTSSDFEDIIYIIDNNKDLINETKKSDSNVKSFLKKMCNEILSNQSLIEIIECHLNPYTAAERRKIVISKLQSIVDL